MSRGARSFSTVAMLGCALALAARAHAGPVAVMQPAPQAAAIHQQILRDVYGAQSTQPSGLSLNRPRIEISPESFAIPAVRPDAVESTTATALTATNEAIGADETPAASLYLQCWEDRFAAPADANRDDLLIEIRVADDAAQLAIDQPLLIPLPPAAWQGIAGLLAVAWGLRGRRRRA